MANLPFHPEALAEYEGTFRWYRARSPLAADRFEAEVERVLELIQNRPEMFAHYDSAHRFALLERFPFSVVYQYENNLVYVVAIAHSSRKPGYWSDRH